MNYANASEIWWPSPSALDDLNVIDTETGFDLEAPEGTECGEWLAYFNETPERKEAFERAFIEMLKTYSDLILNGQTQDQPDQQESNRVEAQEDLNRPVSEHEPGCDPNQST